MDTSSPLLLSSSSLILCPSAGLPHQFRIFMVSSSWWAASVPAASLLPIPRPVDILCCEGKYGSPIELWQTCLALGHSPVNTPANERQNYKTKWQFEICFCLFFLDWKLFCINYCKFLNELTKFIVTNKFFNATMFKNCIFSIFIKIFVSFYLQFFHWKIDVIPRNFSKFLHAKFLETFMKSWTKNI